jgi:hypothetical protein
MTACGTWFCSRHNWGRQVAYASQFEGQDDRAWRGKRKIKARLAVEGDPDDWDLPPKPKWMRWRTYQRYVDKYDHYEGVLEEGIVELVARRMGRDRLLRAYSPEFGPSLGAHSLF